MAPASGPKPQRPSPQSLISTSPQESLSWNPTAFTHTRARLPRTNPCEDPNPTYLNQSRGQYRNGNLSRAIPRRKPARPQLPDPRTPSLTPFKDTDHLRLRTNHEGHPDPEAPEMDFTLWLSGVGRFGLQVKDIR